jgi:peroxiredoxin
MKNLLVASLLLISITSFGQNLKSKILEGQKAPMFKAVDQNGKTISSKEILKNEELILVFYRGEWCPYCNKQLSHLQDHIGEFKQAGARLIAITPETLAGIEKTIGKTDAEYSILHDENNKIMKRYGVDFVLPKKTQEKYKGHGIDLTVSNGNDEQILPVPATYVIGKDGIVKYVQYDPDYKNRSNAEEILKHL